MRTDRPAAAANAARNARREQGRRARWAPVRDELWALLQDIVRPGDRVAVVGAGNGDDLPLARLAAVAGSVTLLDVDGSTARRARGRVRRGLRRRIRVLEHDVTLGAADRLVDAARPSAGSAPASADRPSGARASHGPRTDVPASTTPEPRPLPGGPYDVVLGDLFYSQLLYPGMLDAGVPVDHRRAVLDREGASLTKDVVARLHGSAPVVVHLHDLACWGNGYPQPVALEAILDAAARDDASGLEMADRTKGPREADPRTAVGALDVPVLQTRLWRWPFVPGVDYLVVATVAGRGS